MVTDALADALFGVSVGHVPAENRKQQQQQALVHRTVETHQVVVERRTENEKQPQPNQSR